MKSWIGKCTALVVLATILASCASQGGASGDYPLPEPDGTRVYQAWLVARTIDDPSNLSLALAAVAERWLARGDDGAVRALLLFWDRRLERMAPGSTRRQLTLAMVETMLLAGESAMALEHLQDLLRLMTSVSGPTPGAEELANLVRACFTDPEQTSEVLRRAILHIYALEDPWLRASLLTDLAAYYEGTGGQRAMSLLQQSVPASLALGNPFQRALALSLTAQGFSREGAAAEAGRWAGEARLGLVSIQALTLSPGDQEYLARSLELLAPLVDIAELAPLAGLLDRPSDRLRYHAAVARQHARSRNTFLYRLSLQRMRNVLGEDSLAADALLLEALRLREVVSLALPGELRALDSLWGQWLEDGGINDYTRILALGLLEGKDMVAVIRVLDSFVSPETALVEAMALGRRTPSGEEASALDRWIRAALQLTGDGAGPLSDQWSEGVRAGWILYRAYQGDLVGVDQGLTGIREPLARVEALLYLDSLVGLN